MLVRGWLNFLLEKVGKRAKPFNYSGKVILSQRYYEVTLKREITRLKTYLWELIGFSIIG